MNAHVPQSIGATAELQEVMGVKDQIVSAENNGVMISLCQDSLVSVYLLTRIRNSGPGLTCCISSS